MLKPLKTILLAAPINKYPNGVNPALLADQRAAGDNAAVTILPSFSPIGINGGYYYARANYKF